jgi:predicted DNA repair protein MutK
MASSLLTLLDDVASVLDDVAILTKLTARKAAGTLDDVAVLTKLSARKTAGVLGDDLAVNAEQVTGVEPRRELAVVWAVAKGSAWNKVILVPAALAISAVAPWAVVPLLMLGGAFLCFEGFEKLAHKLLHARAEREAHHDELVAAAARSTEDLLAFERDKIKGAIRTDFILSAEIVAITLGTVADAPFATRVAVLIAIAAIMTVGVYGFVAAIVKLDDVGLSLAGQGGARAALGRGIVAAAPWLMKTLSVLGTAAMFLVGGGILVHGVAPLHHWIEGLAHGLGGALSWTVPTLANGAVGVVAGGVATVLSSGVAKLLPQRRAAGAAE